MTENPAPAPANAVPPYKSPLNVRIKDDNWKPPIAAASALLDLVIAQSNERSAP